MFHLSAKQAATVQSAFHQIPFIIGKGNAIHLHAAVKIKKEISFSFEYKIKHNSMKKKKSQYLKNRNRYVIYR